MLEQFYSNVGMSLTNAAKEAIPFRSKFRQHILEWSVPAGA